VHGRTAGIVFFGHIDIDFFSRFTCTCTLHFRYNRYLHSLREWECDGLGGLANALLLHTMSSAPQPHSHHKSKTVTYQRYNRAPPIVLPPLPSSVLVLRQPQPPSNVPAYDVALGGLGCFASVRFECLLQHASVEEAI
jgi:hypothetical protein